MKYKFLQALILMAAMCVSGAYAQEVVKKKRFSAAIMFGRGAYLSDLTVPASPTATDWTIAGEAPSASGKYSVNDATNMVGAEFRYFLSDKIALKVNGGAFISNTPAQDNIPGVINTTMPNAGWIPNYAAVKADNKMDLNINIGGEYHFINESKFTPILGITLPFCYSRWSQYDPTYNVDVTQASVDKAVTIADVGNRHIEGIGFGIQGVAGGEYAFSDRLYLGMEIKPVSYMYAMSIATPAPGLETREADTHLIGFFTQPVIKLGFKF